MELPPGPSGDWLLGSLRPLRDEPLSLFSRAIAEHGDVVRFQLLHRTLILVTNPDAVSHVLKEQARNYTKMTHGVRKLRKLMDGVALADGQQWIRRRKLINPSFRSHALTRFLPMMRAQSLAAMGRFSSRGKCGAPLDFSHEMSRVTLAIACQAFFGSEAPPPDDIYDAIGVLLDEARVRPYRMMNAPLWFPNRANRAYNGAVAAIGRWAQEQVLARDAEEQPRDDLLSALLGGVADAEPLSMGELIEELQVFLVAAHDTTANAILWTLYYLAQHRELLHAAEGETSALVDGPSCPEDLQRLPLLERVFNEALRLKSPAWIMPRSPLEHDEIGGYSIPKGCSVYISPYLTHRHPAHWPDPERFDPRRFEPSAQRDRHPTAFIPFGAGPRQCIGREFARMEALTFLSMFLSRYHFDVLDLDAIRQVPLVTLKPSTFRVSLQSLPGPRGAAPTDAPTAADMPSQRPFAR